MKKGRRKKVRFVQEMPKISQFSPRGKPGRPDEAELRIDQYEAIKLADGMGHNQAEAAKIMGISRPTFGRILRNGRKIIADALTNGKTIKIRIGDVQVGISRSISPNNESFDNYNQEKNEQTIRKIILRHTHSPKKHKKRKTFSSQTNNTELAR